MVEASNRVVDSQAAEKVRKVLRSDPDKGRDKTDKQKKEKHDREEVPPQPTDEVIISTDKKLPMKQNARDEEAARQLTANKKLPEQDDDESAERDQIDVTA